MRRIMIIVVMLGILFALIGFGVIRRNQNLLEVERTIAGESSEISSFTSGTSTEMGLLD